MLNSIFKKINLTSKEAEIYESLLVNGASTAGNLSKKTGISRSSLYGYLYSLAGKGLVEQNQQHEVKFWEAAEPEKIGQLIDKEMAEAKSVQQQFANLLPSLLKKQSYDSVLPKIRYFEGIDEVKYAYKDPLLGSNIKSFAFWPIRDMLNVLGDKLFIELHRERIQKKIHLQVVWPANQVVDIKKKTFLGVGKPFYREIRKAPKDINASMGYWIYGNKVLFISSKKENFGFIVESNEFSRLMKSQFDLLWQSSTTIRADLKYTKSFLESVIQRDV